VTPFQSNQQGGRRSAETAAQWQKPIRLVA
jgi:hypothetical protein